MRIGSSRVEQPARRGEISDDDEEECQQGGGICPSCRLAVNKDTGRLKWCMGGNDIWRTRIRFMLLIPAVILPVTIIIIVLSKSTVIGKLSMSNYEHAPTASPLAADQPRSSFMPAGVDDIEHIAVADRLVHPDVETSFVPVQSLITSQTLHRHKRDMKQADGAGSTGQPGSIQPRPSKSRSATHSAATAVKSQLLQELQTADAAGTDQ